MKSGLQARIDARLEAKSAAWLGAKESKDALLHHQPTPSSIANAVERLREVSAQSEAAVKQAQERART